MNLAEIYKEGGMRELRRLAHETETNPTYLYQCAVGWRGRIPSPRTVAKLIEVEPRLTFDDEYRPLIAVK